MPETNLQKSLVTEIRKLCNPISLSIENSAYLKELFKEIGWDFDQVDGFPYDPSFLSAISALGPLIDDVESLISSPPESLEDLPNALGIIKDLIDGINSLQSFSGLSTAGLPSSFISEFNNIGKDLVNYLVCDYLRKYYPKLYGALIILGIIDYEVVDPVTPTTTSELWARDSYFKTTVELSNLGDILSDPEQFFKDKYYPIGVTDIGSDSDALAFSDNFFPNLMLFLSTLGFDCRYGINPDDESLYTATAYDLLRRTFTARLYIPNGPDLGISFVIDETTTGVYGLYVKFLGNWTYAQRFGSWYIDSSVGSAIDTFSIDKNGIHFPTTFTGGAFNTNISITKFFPDEQRFLLGSATGTRFEISAIVLNAFLDFISSKTNYGGGIHLLGMHLFIKGGDGDGFINKLLGNGIDSNFDLSIGWSEKSGLVFGGSGSLEILLPVHISLGPIDFKNLVLKIGIDSGDIILTAGATITAKIGPVFAMVENLGLKGTLSFPTSGSNLGITDLKLGFKPPNGIGLSVNASVIKGAGYLYIDTDKGLYYGAAQLSIKEKINVVGVGIVTTKNPDGTKGYSFLLLIAATFSPGIPIAMGFSLTGIGGLLGINRDMNAQALRDGVRNKGIDRIMFPQNPVENIDAIIKDLQAFFPAAQGRYTFGIMFQITWGPAIPLVTINLGLIINLPEPVRLAIVGTVKVALPTKETAILELNVAFVGIIDFDKKYMSFDATIYDSHLLILQISGDLAVRIFWGEHKEMVFSAGGFHPAFSPASYLMLPAKMTRLTISIADGGVLQLSLATYFAITSNTVQFGAELKLDFNAGVRVRGELGFDALFQFSPFYMMADAHGCAELSVFGYELMAGDFHLGIQGPNPWHAKGHINYSFARGIIKGSANMDRTWGTTVPDVPPPTHALGIQVRDDLGLDKNWESVMPDVRQLMISVKQLPPASLVIMPMGILTITQKVAPLEMKLERYGTQLLSDSGFYKIDEVRVSGIVQPLHPVRDNFAPAQFLNMKDDDKLKAESFEYLKNGVKVTVTDDNAWSTAIPAIRTRRAHYHTIEVDEKHRLPPSRRLLNNFMTSNFSKGSAAAANGVTRSNVAHKNRPIVNAGMAQEKYQFKKNSSLATVSSADVPGALTEYTSMAEAMSFYNAQNDLTKRTMVVVPVNLLP